MNEIMTIMVGNEIGEVESINGFFYTVALCKYCFSLFCGRRALTGGENKK